MNVTGKLDLDGLLKGWPAPATRDDAAWEERADQVVEAAKARRSEETAALAALLDPPGLVPEPGEPSGPAAQAVGDGTNMSQESDEGRASKPGASPAAARASDKKRPSLKEIAERASQSGRVSVVPGMPSSRGSVPPGRVSAPPSRGSMPPGRVSAPPSRGSMPPGGRAVEAGKDDSGVVDLNIINTTATSEQKAAAEKAKPGTADLFEEDKPVVVAAVSAKQPRAAAAAPVAAKKKGNNGVIAGGVIALFGLAAAFAIMRTPKDAAAPVAVAPTPVATSAPMAEKTEAKPMEVAAAAPAAQEKPAEPDEKPAEAAARATAPTGTGVAVAAAATEAPPAAVASKTDPGKVAAATPPPAGKPGDLSTAMQAAVGSDGAKATSVVTEAPEPAAGKRDQSIPEQPSQGSVQAAVGSVMAAAKSCVSGADDVSRAQITFSSAGAVSNVSVTGWAASNGQAACVKSALKSANVGAFSKASFSVGVTIRP